MDSIKKIIIADDHSIVSRGLHYLITMNFNACQVSQASSQKELLTRLTEDEYTHLILDLNMEEGSSIEILPEIIEHYPNLQILIYSMASEEVFAKKLMQFNISGFLSKKSEEHEILRALTIFLQGGIFLSKKIKRSLDAGNTYEEGRENVFRHLTIAELKVLDLLLKGNRTKEIANELGLAQQTVATFKSRIFKKLETDNVFEIQRLADLHQVSFT